MWLCHRDEFSCANFWTSSSSTPKPHRCPPQSQTSSRSPCSQLEPGRAYHLQRSRDLLIFPCFSSLILTSAQTHSTVTQTEVYPGANNDYKENPAQMTGFLPVDVVDSTYINTYFQKSYLSLRLLCSLIRFNVFAFFHINQVQPHPITSLKKKKNHSPFHKYTLCTNHPSSKSCAFQ